MDKPLFRSNLNSVLTGFYWLKIGIYWDFPVTKSSNINQQHKTKTNDITNASQRVLSS